MSLEGLVPESKRVLTDEQEHIKRIRERGRPLDERGTLSIRKNDGSSIIRSAKENHTSIKIPHKGGGGSFQTEECQLVTEG